MELDLGGVVVTNTLVYRPVPRLPTSKVRPPLQFQALQDNMQVCGGEGGGVLCV